MFYVQLSKMGFGIDYVDIGGGLGVDYDGTRSSASGSSMNYSIQEYANDAIYSLVDVCEKNGLPQPNIVTESGLASRLIIRFSSPRCLKQHRFPPGRTMRS